MSGPDVTPKTESPCIETDWWRDESRGGYGRRWIDGKNWRAHRYAWTQANGPIPPGLLVCHRCDNPACINVEHLFLGTYADNNHDRDAKGRQVAPAGDRNGSRTKPHRRVRGARHHLTRLTEEDVAAIRACPLSEVKTAALFGIAPSSVGRIKRREVWNS